ncbi:MAG: HEPN domain-containing protein [Sideroxyarcus sp.]|nr:HEPN domain-containing protein [Sideroxyarcus sp.]
MKADDLMVKARQAVASAKVLLHAGDVDGACNRAYYSMFDAARAALLFSRAPVELDDIKTHSGLIATFGLHLVKTGQVPVELGKALNKVEDLRLIADYKGEQVLPEKAAWAVQQAEIFIQAMQSIFSPGSIVCDKCNAIPCVCDDNPVTQSPRI